MYLKSQTLDSTSIGFCSANDSTNQYLVELLANIDNFNPIFYPIKSKHMLYSHEAKPWQRHHLLLSCLQDQVAIARTVAVFCHPFLIWNYFLIFSSLDQILLALAPRFLRPRCHNQLAPRLHSASSLLQPSQVGIAPERTLLCKENTCMTPQLPCELNSSWFGKTLFV